MCLILFCLFKNKQTLCWQRGVVIEWPFLLKRLKKTISDWWIKELVAVVAAIQGPGAMCLIFGSGEIFHADLLKNG